MDKINHYKTIYNHHLVKANKAWNYFGDISIPWEVKEKHLAKLHNILRMMDHILEEIGDYDRKNILSGF